MRRLLSRAAVGAVVVGVACLGVAAPAAAHSDLEEASPGPGDEVAAGSSLIHLEFGEQLVDDDVNRVLITDQTGDAVATGAPSLVDDDLGACASTDALSAGEYVVDWRFMSVDGHPVQSRYSFEVADGGDEVEAADCDGADLASPQATEEGFAVGTPAIVGVGALALLAVVLLLVRRVRADRRAAGRGA